MKLTWNFRSTLAVTVLLVVINFRFASSCSCLPTHPQDQFCNNDFVLLVKIKDISRPVNDTERDIKYHVALRKIFKMADKASLVLKPKILWSSDEESMCGVKLKKNMKYLVTGRVLNNKAKLSLCNYHQLWTSLSTKQRKGFRLLYKQGCECKIQLSYCQNSNPDKCPRNHNTCLWEMWKDKNRDCQRLHGVCMRQAHGRCDWNKSRAYRTCSKERKRQREMEP